MQTRIPQPGAAPHLTLADPRTDSGFNPNFFPTANGQAAPPVGADGGNERIILEFLTVYYELNRQYHAWLQVRTSNSPDAGRGQERECLRAIEKAAIQRDGLEDRFAPFGVTAEPRVQAGLVTEVTFSFGNVDAQGRKRRGLLTISAYVPLPWKPGASLDTLALRIEGEKTRIP